MSKMSQKYDCKKAIIPVLKERKEEYWLLFFYHEILITISGHQSMAQRPRSFFFLYSFQFPPFQSCSFPFRLLPSLLSFPVF